MADRTEWLPLNAPVREGEILAGKYRVEEVLGVGGMGVVVAARHLELDDRVAIKFMLPEALANAEAVARFAREARAAVKIKSEHVARVSDVGKLENGAPYMVMEYLEGTDLSAWLRERGALPVEQAVEFILQACEAIAEAHALGIVHRDLKPANLFVIRRTDARLSVKVLDFGISKVTGLGGSGEDASMTTTSALMGSPYYMSPEQMQSSRDVDARADIWALGIILYELITGAPPFRADTMPKLVLKIMSAPPPPLLQQRPDAPAGLEAVLFRCLDKDRGQRFETVGALAVALLPFAPRRSKASVERISGVMQAAGYSASTLALPPSSDERPDPAVRTGTAASWGRTTTGQRPPPWLVLAGGAAVVALGVGVALTRSKAPAERASASSEVSTAQVPVVTVSTPPAPMTPRPANTAASVPPVPTADPVVPVRAFTAASPTIASAKVGGTQQTPVAPLLPAKRPAVPPSIPAGAPLKSMPKPVEKAAAPAPTAPPAPVKPSMYEDRK